MSPQERVFYKDDDPVKVIYVAAGFSASIDISWSPGIEGWREGENGPCSPVNLSSTPWLGRVCLSAPNVCENLQLSRPQEIFKDFFPSWDFSIVPFLFVNKSKQEQIVLESDRESEPWPWQRWQGEGIPVTGVSNGMAGGPDLISNWYQY